jgi:hypothetical protein
VEAEERTTEEEKMGEERGDATECGRESVLSVDTSCHASVHQLSPLANKATDAEDFSP